MNRNSTQRKFYIADLRYIEAGTISILLLIKITTNCKIQNFSQNLKNRNTKKVVYWTFRLHSRSKIESHHIFKKLTVLRKLGCFLKILATIGPTVRCGARSRSRCMGRYTSEKCGLTKLGCLTAIVDEVNFYKVQVHVSFKMILMDN